MADTPILKLPQVAPGQNQKELTINTALAILEAAMNDSFVHTGKTTSFALNEDQWTRYFLHRVSGNVTPITMTVPARERLFVVSNEGTAALTVTPVGGGPGNSAEVPFGKIVLMVNDGINVYAISSGVGRLQDLSDVDGTGAMDGSVLSYDETAEQWVPVTVANLFDLGFLGLNDTPNSYSGQASRLIRVNAAGNALEFFVPSLTTLSDVNTALDPDDGDVLTFLDGKWISAPVGAANVDFIDLSDVPETYTGQGGKAVVVKTTEDGIEFLPIRDTILELTDTPDAYTGQAGKTLVVNPGETAMVFATPTGGSVRVDDEGLQVQVAANKVNFAGAGVTVTDDTTGGVLVTIPGGGGGGPSDPDSHLYWRVFSTGSNNYFSVTELQMRSLVGGVDQTTGGTALSSGNYLSSVPANAFDNSASTEWSSAVGMPEWIAYQFATPISIVEVVLTASFVNAASESLSTGSIDWSDDGVTWTTAWTLPTQGAWTNLESRTFTDPSALDTTFLLLPDTPDTYTGQAGKAVAVNSGSTALEFVPFPTGGSTIAVEDEATELTVAATRLKFAGTGVTATEATPDVVTITVPGHEVEVITAKSGDYTFVMTDANDVVPLNSAANFAFTIPPNADVAFPVGTQISGLQMGVGKITFTAGIGVTINRPAALTLMTREQWSVVMALKIATNTWVLLGDMGAV